MRDRIRYKDINKGLRVKNIEEKMKENRLKWFEHVQRRGIRETVRKVESCSFGELKRGRVRTKMIWGE